MNTNRISLFLIFYVLFNLFQSETIYAAYHDRLTQSMVQGTVTDTEGIPLAGVSIQVESTNRGTITDIDGTFNIQAGPNDALVFSYVGFTPQNIPIDGREVLMVQMEENIAQLGEVVLNAGYYTVSQKERTGNIATIKA